MRARSARMDTHATPSDLHRACCKVIAALEGVQSRTPAQRRKLVEQTRALLLALALCLRHSASS